MYNNLSEFIQRLKEANEIKFIKDSVSPIIEISRYTDDESKSKNGGKALYFMNVKDSDFPVVTNIFGSDKRICMALGVNNLNELAERIEKYIKIDAPKSFKEILTIIKMVIITSKFFPRKFRGKKPPCQEVVYTGKDVDLSKLPVLQCWPKDAGRFITLPLVITKSIVTGKRNTGMYRLQIFDKNTTGMHWHIHKDGSHYYKEYRKKNLRMPVAVAIGASPAVTYSATAPLPKGFDEMLLAGFINNKPVYMTKCLTIDMEVPAEAEFILEGYVEPDEMRIEGPFGDHTGYYSLADYYPVFHVTAITHRKNPIYNATLVGRPPMEDCFLAKATERIFLPLIKAIMPEIRDYSFPIEGVFHNIVIVSIDKEYPGHAHKVISGLWGQGQMSFCKAIIVVDKEIDPSDRKVVIKRLLAKLDITSDMIMTKGALDVLDHSSPNQNFGSKIGIDLTERFKGEPLRSFYFNTSENLIPKKDIKKILLSKISGVIDAEILFEDITGDDIKKILAVAVEKSSKKGGHDFSSELLKLGEISFFDIIILFDKDIDIKDSSLMLWKVFNNVEPVRDIIIEKHRIVIDACKKGASDGHHREWPADLTFDMKKTLA